MNRALSKPALLLCLLAGLGAACRPEAPEAPETPAVEEAVPARLPEPRAGADRLGEPLLDRLPARVVRGSLRPPGTRAILVRWWTDGCPFCASSLPAIETLAERYGARGLHTVGVYHPKPPREVEAADVLAHAEQLGFSGALLADPQWAVLRDFWLDTGERRATSVSFLLDAEGVVRFVHPGPEFFPSEDEEHAEQDADFRDLERAVRALLE